MSGEAQILDLRFAGKRIGTNLKRLLARVIEMSKEGIPNRVLSNAGLAIGTSSKKKVKVVNRLDYCFDNVAASIAASTEVAFTATTHDIAADASLVKEAYYLLSVDSAGTVTVTKGATATTGAGVLPDTPANGIAFGYVRIRVAAGSTIFDATSDDLDAAHLTVVYVNLAGKTTDTRGFTSTAPNSW